MPAQINKVSRWFMNICTGSYDIPTAFLSVDGIYTNKAPEELPIGVLSGLQRRHTL